MKNNFLKPVCVNDIEYLLERVWTFLFEELLSFVSSALKLALAVAYFKIRLLKKFSLSIDVKLLSASKMTSWKSLIVFFREINAIFLFVLVVVFPVQVKLVKTERENITSTSLYAELIPLPELLLFPTTLDRIIFWKKYLVAAWAFNHLSLEKFHFARKFMIL